MQLHIKLVLNGIIKDRRFISYFTYQSEIQFFIKSASSCAAYAVTISGLISGDAGSKYNTMICSLLQPARFISASVAIAKFNLKRCTISQQFNHCPNLSGPQVVFRKVNGQCNDI